MGTRSSIKRLPPEIRAEVDRLLMAGKYTNAQIAEHIRSLGHAVSKSAVHRYSQDVEEVAKEIRYTREVAQAIGRELQSDPEHDEGRMLIDSAHSLLLRLRLQLSRSEELDSEVVRNFCDSLKKVEDTRGKNRQNLEKERASVLAEAQAAIEQTAIEQGLSAGAVEAFRATMLGLQHKKVA